MKQLPIDQKIPEILEALEGAHALVLSAAPGAGKTTRLPPELLSLTDKKVWVLEPRRVAAVAAAHRIAEEQGWNVGDQVGYQVRFENKTSSKTRLVFLTEALLNRKILQDPNLNEVGVVVLDEFHERSVHVDIALGLLKELQMLSRPDLKIVVMSATLETKPLCEFLETSVSIDVPGNLFALETSKIKESQLLRTDQHFIGRVAQAIQEHVRFHPQGKDILVFLPGQSEISRCEEKLRAFSDKENLLVLPLTGSLRLSDQMRVLQPQVQRKVILATNVAESSITIDGVDTVIDSGLARVLRRNSKTEFEELVIARISKASAKQRAGRAARQFAGRCIQLWSQHDEKSMRDFEVAEVHRTDLAQTVLFLKKWGVADLASFAWYEAPTKAILDSTEQMLERLGALRAGEVTERGARLATLPLSPRLGQVLLVAEELGATDLGRDLCALLSERDIKVSSQSLIKDDFVLRLEVLQEFREGGKVLSKSLLKNVDKVSRQLKKYIAQGSSTGREGALEEVFLLSFPDRLCRRRKKGGAQALMVGGRGVVVAETSLSSEAEFFVAVDLMETGGRDTKVSRVANISKKTIEANFEAEIKLIQEVSFDEESRQFFLFEYKALWGLPLEEPRRRPATAGDVEGQLAEILSRSWDLVLKENKELFFWWQRWEYYRDKTEVEEFWNENKKLEAFQMASMGESRWETVIEKDLVFLFESLMEADRLKDFKSKCPAKVLIPTGKKLRLHYHSYKDPHLEVRLQELFGQQEPFKVWQGEVVVTIHLLGPNYRPVQMTSDLLSFWQNTYPEVRKEMRARYPKHSWPEDPLRAIPTDQTKRRK